MVKEIDIEDILLLTGRTGPDILVLHTKLPQGMWPYEGHGTLDMKVAAGEGERYCAENFPGIPVQTIKT